MASASTPSTKRRLRRATVALVFIGVLGAAVGVLLHKPPAPEVRVQLLDGRTVSLSSLRGRPVLVNFWATSCPSCIAETPALAAMYRRLAPRGLELLAIAMAYDPPVRVAAFARGRELPYPVALDIDASAARAFGGIQGTPTWFLIDAEGRVRWRHSGALDIARLGERLERLLDEGVGGAGNTSRCAEPAGTGVLHVLFGPG